MYNIEQMLANGNADRERVSEKAIFGVIESDFCPKFRTDVAPKITLVYLASLYHIGINIDELVL